MYNYTKRCKDCDSILWSDYAKSIGLCPECECVDCLNNLDLEDQLEELLAK